MSKIDEWTNEIHQGDSIELLTEIPDDTVDLVLTDPPYNISKRSENIEGVKGMGRRSAKGRSGEGDLFNDFGEWDKEVVFHSDWAGEAERILHEEGGIITFYDALKMDEAKEALREAGFGFFSKYYWMKPNPAPRIRTNIMMSAIEEMWFAARGGGGSHYINEDLKQRISVIEAPPPNGSEHTVHPTQKPVSVMAELIRYHCPPDGVVLDPFLGSGTTAVAAEKVGRDWIAFEREDEYIEMAQDRLKNETYHEGSNALEAEW